MKTRAIIYVLLLASFSCQKQNTSSTDLKLSIISEQKPQYAEGFTIFTTNLGTLIEVTRPHPGATVSLYYLLVEDSLNITLPDSITPIKIPVQSLICTSTSHIPMLHYLGVEKILKGFPNTDYISTPSVRNLIEEGQVIDLGNSQALNLEKLLEVDPDLVMMYSMNDLQSVSRLEEYGQSTFINSDFLESDPLGRAEWIKMGGLLFDKKKEADSIFSSIASAYNRLKEFHQSEEVPSVISGSVYGDAWFLPGGENYAAKLLSDAGYNYLWSDSPSHEFLELGFENVFEKGIDAEYWISPAPFKNLNGLMEADQRYGEFNAFKEGKVYVYDNKIGATGGNEYLEEGYLRPDIILKDLIKIRQPDNLPDHKLYFYRVLK